MTSSRLPGKVLAPLQGRPVLRHVIDGLSEAGVAAQDIVVLTSDEMSDDPVAAYADTLGVGVFRGSLQNVMRRFIDASEAYPSDWVLRITADSPYHQPQVIRFGMAAALKSTAPFATTTYKRTLPKGMNIELFQPYLLHEAVSQADTSEADLEHVTSCFHRRPPSGGVCSIEFEGADFSQHSVAIDSLDDLKNFQVTPPTALIESLPWAQLTSRVVLS